MAYLESGKTKCPVQKNLVWFVKSKIVVVKFQVFLYFLVPSYFHLECAGTNLDFCCTRFLFYFAFAFSVRLLQEARK